MNKLINLTKKIRYSVCKMSHNGAAHLGSSLSCVDILVTIFFSGIFKFNQKKILLRDKFILSKGHAASALYSVLAYKNYFSKKQLLKYGKNSSYFEEHPNSKINGVICSTGSLGHGLSFGIGLAISDKLKKKNYKTVILMSDGECNEGTVWEAASFASAQNLSNIIVLIDHNKWQATGRTSEITGGNLIDKWLAFGWHTFDIDGNNVNDLKNVLKKAKKSKKPVAIIANTIKGKGIHFMEDDNNWHYRIPNIEELNKIKILLNQ